MRTCTPWALALILCIVATGCGGADDEAATEETADTPAAAVETAEAEPEAAPIPLPEGWPEYIPMYPGLEITEAEIVDVDKGMFKVVGVSRSNYEDILDHYEVVFREAGWTEDMAMANEGTSIISASKDGFLVTVEAHEGGLGCYITYTTGNL